MSKRVAGGLKNLPFDPKLINYVTKQHLHVGPGGVVRSAHFYKETALISMWGQEFLFFRLNSP